MPAVAPALALASAPSPPPPLVPAPILLPLAEVDSEEELMLALMPSLPLSPLPPSEAETLERLLDLMAWPSVRRMDALAVDAVAGLPSLSHPVADTEPPEPLLRCCECGIDEEQCTEISVLGSDPPRCRDCLHPLFGVCRCDCFA